MKGGAPSVRPPSLRRRAMLAALAAAVMAAGLLLRSDHVSLPAGVAKYGGDALWAWLVFCGLAFLFSRAGRWRVAGAALGFAWAVEFSQLWHAEWLDRLRATRAGALALGSTFNWPDFPAYAAGIAAGVALDAALVRITTLLRC